VVVDTLLRLVRRHARGGGETAIATVAGRRLDAAVRTLAEGHAALLQEVAALDRSEAWRAEGYGSMDQWLVARCGYGRATAVSYVRTAHRLAEETEVARMLAHAEISFDQARALCRLNATETDRIPSEIREKSADQIQRLARRQEKLDIDDVVLAHRWRYLRWDWSKDKHALHLRAALPHDQGAVLLTAIHRLIHTMPPNAEDGIYDTYEAYAADALYQLASMRLGRDRDPDRASVVVHVDAERFDKADSVGVIEDGATLAIETARRWACDARIETVAEDNHGTAVGIGRAARKIPAWLARQVRERDHGCRFPGCERTRWVHIRHLIHWAHGGSTNLDNLITSCPYHHRLVHEYGWSISGDPNGEVEFVRPDGGLFRYPDPGIIDPDHRFERRNRRPGPWVPTPEPDT
jgi:hypothetical protein